MISNGVDPNKEKKKDKSKSDGKNTFLAVAEELLKKDTVSPEQVERKRRFLELDIFPFFGDKDIDKITKAEVVEAIDRIQSRGALEQGKRTFTIVKNVFKYAAATGRIEYSQIESVDPSIAFKKPIKGKYPNMTDPDKIGELLIAIDSYAGLPVVKYALKIAPHVFVRSQTLREMKWEEIDFEKKIWATTNIKQTTHNKKEAHITPLSRQVIAMLKEVQKYTGREAYVFPGITKGRPLSENTLNVALRRLGYSADELVFHSFRKIASTQLNEYKLDQGFDRDMIEIQLSHIDGSVRGDYNHAKYIEKRREMMQWWSDHLDELKEKRAKSHSH